jgi:hypothetical protein
MEWLVAWRLVRPFLPYIAAAMIVAALLSAYGHREYGRGADSRNAEVAALNGTIANMKAASEKALALNDAYVSRINGLQDQITKEKNDAVPQRLADGSAAIDAYVRLHPAPKANPGNASQDHASGLPGTAGQADASANEAIVSRADLDACNAAWVTATGLQDWIRAQASIDRNTP